MKRFMDLSMGCKLGIGFGVCLALMMVIGGVGISRINDLRVGGDTISKSAMAGTAAAGRISSYMREYRTYEFRHCTSDTLATKQVLETKMLASADKIDKVLNEYDGIAAVPEDKENFKGLKSDWQTYTSHHADLLSLSRAGKMRPCLGILNGVLAKVFLEHVQPETEKLVNWNVDQGKKMSRASADEAAVAIRMISCLIVAGIIFAGYLGFIIARRVTFSVGVLTRVFNELREGAATGLATSMQAMAAGDLTVELACSSAPVKVHAQDEFGLLAQTYNELLAQMQTAIDEYGVARQSMHDMISRVAESAASVATTGAQLDAAAIASSESATQISRSVQEVADAADQSARTSQEMASGSEQQARSATDAAEAMQSLESAIEEVKLTGSQQLDKADEAVLAVRHSTEIVETVTRTAQRVVATAGRAGSTAEEGGKSVAETVAAMERIRIQIATTADKVKALGEKGEQIGAIVETIDSIAEQTNLLALNAAIEAARAGEHGRGFAVVADEVRKLAERSASATREIGGLIRSVQGGVFETVDAMEVSRREVASGAVASKQAGTALEEILSGARSVCEEVIEVGHQADELMAAMIQVASGSEAAVEMARQNEVSIQTMSAQSARAGSAITSVASVSEETAAGAQEMSASAQEVSASTQNVSASIQEQTATIEQIGAAANSLRGMSDTLAQLVSQFKLDNSQATGLRVVKGGAVRAA